MKINLEKEKEFLSAYGLRRLSKRIAIGKKGDTILIHKPIAPVRFIIQRWNYFALGIWIQSSRWVRLRFACDTWDCGFKLIFGKPRYDWLGREYGIQFYFGMLVSF